MQSNNEIVDKIIVETKLGKICGSIKKSETKSFPDTDYYSFQGIPYAKPPLGSLRFRAPQPPEPWTGIHDGTQEGNPSSQVTYDGEYIGDEDCLFLNVYTPLKPGDSHNELLPIMFWIHGGGFATGSGGQALHSPDYLMPQKNVVVVTINYRLGAFGFLKCNDPNIRVPGNAGCKDVVMALKWVKNHIENFNGDPNNVTIWGQSAGAAIVHTLLLSPMAKGLFHKAIIQSGICFTKFFHGKTETIWIMKMLSAAGYAVSDEAEAFDLLSKLSTTEVARVFKTFHDTVGPSVVFPYITAESSTSLEETYLTQDYESYYLQNKINAVPLLIGTNVDDGLVFAAKRESYGATTPEHITPHTAVPEMLKNLNKKEYEEVGRKIIKFYYGNETPSRRNLDKYARLASDNSFFLSTRHLIQLYQMCTTEPIYRYKFNVQSPHNLYKKMYNISIPSVCHGDELTYLFYTKYSRCFRPNSVEELTLYRMVNLWTNFAKFGNPNIASSTFQANNISMNINWLPVQPGQYNHLNIGKTLKYVKSERDEEMRFKFWDDLSIFFYKNYIMPAEMDEKVIDENFHDMRFRLKLFKEYESARKLSE